ncbi:uncharacterized protein LOC131957926 [Physella acuta]|uniref:uncharacterized protein LOC131957926 n=1 Tax=Physella acuta TaxID=109671 RepID=UPI0027DEAA26|nr:uncharacterized protein LOC131957926 [Physella acuta]
MKICSRKFKKYRIQMLVVLVVMVSANHVIQVLVEDHATEYQKFGDDTRVLGPLTFCQRRSQGGQVTESYDRLTEMNSSRKTMDGQVCQHPQLDPCDPQVLPFDYFVHPVNCSKADDNWVYVDNGTFRISRKSLARYGDITCDYVSVERGETDFDVMEGELIEDIKDGSPITSDFFKVGCKSVSNHRYHNIHVGVAYKESLHSRFRRADPGVVTMGYDVFMFGFDSMSRMAWLRNLPKSREFYTRDLEGMELTGYNIVGDATINNLLPLLTGQSLKDLYSARWDDPYASHVDDFPFIWKSFKSAGYVTAWGEDMAFLGTFQKDIDDEVNDLTMRLVGFNSTPTDHSMRPYFIAAESMYKHFLPYCVGSEPLHIRFLNWFKDVFKMYGRKPKFVFGFHSEFSHKNNNEMKKMDEDLLNFLKYLNTSGILDHTIMILMSDHGTRYEEVRRTPQGKLEERLPYFSFRFPHSFYDKYPKQFLNFKNNLHKLVTPFDVLFQFYQVTFRTSPNDGIYEATVKHLVPSDSLVVSDWQISRINRYGESADCMQQVKPQLRPFCHCTKSGI